MESDLLKNQHLILRVTEYGLKHQEFKIEDLQTELNLTKDEGSYVRNVLTKLEFRTTDNPNHVFVLFRHVNNNIGGVDWKKSTYTLVPNAFYNYVDYLEIIEARKAAEQAREQSSTAIQISIWALVAAIAFGAIEIFLPSLMKHNP